MAEMAAVVKQLQENNARQDTLDKAILQQAVETKEIFLTSLGKLGESLRDTLKDTTDDLTAAVLAPPKDDKLESQEEENQNRQSRILESIGNGIKGLGVSLKNLPGNLTEGAKKIGKGGFKGLLATLGGAAFGGAMLAILGFMNSPYWDKTLKLINDDIIPAIQYLFEVVLVPIGNFLKDTFLRAWEDIGALFDGIGDAITKFQEGDILGGITTLIGSLGTFFINTVDNLITGVFNLFGGIFGLEKTDSVFGEISRFVTDTYNSIVGFFSNTFNFFGDIISGAWTNTKDFVQGVFDAIVGFFTGAFTWTKDAVVSTWEGLQNFAGNAYDKVTGFFSDGFSFASEKVSGAWNGLQNFASGAYEGITGFFSDSFSFAKEGLQDFNLFQFAEGVVGDAISSVKAIFSGDFSIENFKTLFGSLFDIVTYPVNLAVNAVKDIFSFGSEDASPFRLSDFFFGQDGVIPTAIKKITDMFAITEDFFADIDLGDMAKNFMKGLLQAILPPPDFLSFKVDGFSIMGKEIMGPKEFNLNPIPDSMYQLAGINPKTGRTFAEESAEAQEALEAALKEQYGPGAAPAEALFSEGMGKGGDTYITYTDASNNSQTTQNQQSTYVPITNSANKTSSMDD